MRFNDRDAIERAQYYLSQAGTPWTETITLHNFKEFYNKTVDYIRFGMDTRQRGNIPREWAERFAALWGDFDWRLKRDPPLAYLPRTPKHAAFHDSTAFIRYSPAGNGCGKTDMAYIENLWCSTGRKHWTGQRGNVVIVSTGHAGYSEKVFTVKFVQGEDGDPLTPMVPEDGYYFHSFDQRKYLLRIACDLCAEANKPKSCTHTRSIHCLSADSQVERLMGFTARLAHLDEFVPVNIYREMLQRIRRGNVRGRMIVTGTPLLGPDTWMQSDLVDLYRKRPEDNWTDKETKTERYVELFPITKLDCVGTPGGPTMGQILAEKAKLPDSEYRARVLGEAVPLGDSIFDLNILDKMETEHCKRAEYGALGLASEVSIETLEYEDDLVWQPLVHNGEDTFEGNYVWEHPEADACYVIGADVASGAGVTRRDASVGYVFKVDASLSLKMVAAHYSFMDPLEYAKEIKKLAVYYRQALVIPEINSIGSAFLAKLYKELSYPSVFLGETPAEQLNAGADTRMGVVTNTANKPAMIISLLNYVHSGRLTIVDKEAISECRTFQKERTELGNYRYQAASGAHDDRVMAMAMVAFACHVHADQVAAFAIAPTAPSSRPKKPHVVPGEKPRKRFSF